MVFNCNKFLFVSFRRFLKTKAEKLLDLHEMFIFPSSIFTDIHEVFMHLHKTFTKSHETFIKFIMNFTKPSRKPYLTPHNL